MLLKNKVSTLLMTKIIINNDLHSFFGDEDRPGWYAEAVQYLRGGSDKGLFGLFLYKYIKSKPDISNIINIGTARGHSTVCATKALEDANRNGVVHTIDIIPPDKPRDWHVPKQADDDPLIGKKVTMQDLIHRFHSSSDTCVSINFHTGDSTAVLQQMDVDPDLVFHDGEHTYSTVNEDLRITKSMSSSLPIQVFDDCYLYSTEWDFRPFTSTPWMDIDGVSKLGRILRRVREFSVQKSPFPGVKMAIQDELSLGDYNLVEVVQDEDHAPITVLKQDG